MVGEGCAGELDGSLSTGGTSFGRILDWTCSGGCVDAAQAQCLSRFVRIVCPSKKTKISGSNLHDSKRSLLFENLTVSVFDEEFIFVNFWWTTGF
jgi:hypothetical protein